MSYKIPKWCFAKEGEKCTGQKCSDCPQPIKEKIKNVERMF